MSHLRTVFGTRAIQVEDHLDSASDAIDVVRPDDVGVLVYFQVMPGDVGASPSPLVPLSVAVQ